ncbi:MAG: MFS transporter [Henriciella sp.]|nr:MFS transporter [Henriciella sp.]
MTDHPRPIAVCALLVAGTVLGLSGIDLVLPAIPDLPDLLGGDEARAQLVLAAYTGGTALGLLLYGALGAKFGRRNCLITGLGIFAVLSFLAGLAPTIESLIGLRFIQGVSSAAPAVFAPGIIKALFDERGATKAIGALASIESLTPALAPVAGIGLLAIGGWTLSFNLTAVLAAALTAALIAFRHLLPPTAKTAQAGSYLRLLISPVYLRYAISQACVVGGLLVFVFGAPAVIVNSMGGTMTDFIMMQVIGISTFIIASNTAGRMVDRFGAEPTIWFGTSMAGLGSVVLLITALSVPDLDPLWLTPLFVPVNMGLGFRGPPGFLRAMMSSGGDDDRAASLTILGMLIIAAGGTALLAPVIDEGLPVLAAATSFILVAAMVSLAVFPRLETPSSPAAQGSTS